MATKVKLDNSLRTQVTPTLIVRYSYDTAMAFEGSAAAKFLDLLEHASLVEHKRIEGEGYAWRPLDPDSLDRPRIELITEGIAQAAAVRAMRTRLDEAEAKLRRHADMITAAELLDS